MYKRQLLHDVRKSLAEHGEKLEAADKTAIETALKELDETLKGEDKDAIESRTDALMTASQKLGEKMYSDAQTAQAAAAAGAAAGGAGPQPSAAPSGKPGDDNVVDAEFKEVKRD